MLVFCISQKPGFSDKDTIYLTSNFTCFSLLFFYLKGAKVILGGKRHSLGTTFYEPTVISDANNEMLLSR